MKPSQATYRYPGMLPFRQDQANIFFGRSEELERLYALLCAEKLVVLFGKSGYGKSSLLLAGLFPKLLQENSRKKQQFLPIYIRFNLWDESQSLFDKYYFHLEKAFSEHQIEPANTQVAILPDSLWATFKRWNLTDKLTLVLVFDQFEEFFSYPLEQRQLFEEQLAELLYAAIPLWMEQNERMLTPEEEAYLLQRLDVRALFAIRSDRLAELDKLRQKLPAILHKRQELKAFTPDQAKLAITGPALRGSDADPLKDVLPCTTPFTSPPFEFTPDALATILQELDRSGQTQEAGIEAFLLQLVCRSIEDKVISGKVKDRDGNGIPDVTVEDLPAVEDVFSQYYTSSIGQLAKDDQAIARDLIEYGLLRLDPRTDEARRLSKDRDVLLDDYQVQGLTQRVLDELESIYLLRKEPNSVNSFNYELSHDTLLPAVVNARRIRDAEREKERLAHEARQSEMRLQQEHQRALEEQERKAERSKRKRLRWFSTVTAIMVLLLTLTTIRATRASYEAKDNLVLAEKAEKEAREYARQAEIERDKAGIAREIAIRERQLADSLRNIADSLAGVALSKQKLAEEGLKIKLEAERQLRIIQVQKHLDAAERVLELGDTEMARILLQRARTLDPKNETIKRELQKLNDQ